MRRAWALACCLGWTVSRSRASEALCSACVVHKRANSAVGPAPEWAANRGFPLESFRKTHWKTTVLDCLTFCQAIYNILIVSNGC
jgi:hypothetical protein